jgi:hypothetical protein
MSIAQASGMRAILHLARKQPAAMAEWAQRTREFAAERSITYWLNHASLLCTWLDARSTASPDDAVRYRNALDAYVASGSTLGLPDFSLLMVDLCRMLRDREGAELALQQARHHIQRTGERFIESDVLRSEADLLASASPPDVAGAVLALDAAIDVARRQGAVVSELRGLAARIKLLRRNDLDAGADIASLAALTATFAIELDFPDIIETRHLLAALGEQAGA